jgi:aminoglycoside phosphotransferase family enzyme/predicted kinase
MQGWRLVTAIPTPDTSVSEQRRAFRAWLRRQAGDVPLQFVETHVSILGMSPDRVWKLKKAVRFSFVDLSTAELRRRNAHREVDLNRRFAPDVYLGVVPLSPEDDGRGDVVVEMRRMPEDCRLSVVASRDRDRASECVDRIAVELARIHRDAPRSERIDDAGSVETLSDLWERSLDEMKPFVPAVLDALELQRVAHDARTYLAGRDALFDERVRAGRICDGHGDLLADDVFCLADGPRFLDCLEFDDDLRYGDVVADVAFLAMDLERLGHPSLATHLLNAYRHSSGDPWPASLADLYLAYRALVRSKVACLSVGTADSDAPWTARTLLGLAGEHLARGRIRLVLIGGPPATGKTTVSRALATRTGWVVLHSDEVRKQLAGLEPTTSAAAGLDAGLYTPEWTARTYAALMESARSLLSRGESVILDASWSDGARRAEAEQLAHNTRSAIGRFVLSLPADVADARARLRAQRHADASDASTPVVVGALRGRFLPWPEAVTLEMQRSTNAVISTVLTRLGYPS